MMSNEMVRYLRLQINLLEAKGRGGKGAGHNGDAEGIELRLLTLESEVADERKKNEVCVIVYIWVYHPGSQCRTLPI
jgi:hypothetical protein